MDTTLIVPGLHGSGAGHWQSWLETHTPGAVRVTQHDWADPNLADWTRSIYRAFDRTSGRIWIVAHSFGCLAAVKAAADEGDRIVGAMLVAPADPHKVAIAGLIPDARLDFPSVVVASTNDPWIELSTASRWAQSWGSRFINVGAAGHINAASGHGAWPEGLDVLRALRRHAAPRFDRMPDGPRLVPEHSRWPP